MSPPGSTSRVTIMAMNGMTGLYGITQYPRRSIRTLVPTTSDIPTSSPPSMAPYTLEKPPTMLPANMLGSIMAARLGSPWNHMDISTPAMPARPPLKNHAKQNIVRVLMPSVWASDSFSMAPLMLMPKLVRYSR